MYYATTSLANLRKLHVSESIQNQMGLKHDLQRQI